MNRQPKRFLSIDLCSSHSTIPPRMSTTELELDATTTPANLGMGASVSGVGCLDCKAKITPTMT